MVTLKKIAGWVVVVGLSVAPAWAQEFSTSVMQPAAVDAATGLIRGQFPGSSGKTSYYFKTDLQSGALLSQVSFEGQVETDKSVELELLNSNLDPADALRVYATAEPKQQGTKSFAIDSAGQYVLRLSVSGPATTSFCVLLGGPALPSAKSPGCDPLPKPVNVPPPSAPVTKQPFEVIESKCEQRLRIGSDILFAFDRHELQPAAQPTLRAVEQKLKESAHLVTIEGHTDGKGSDSYNQTLSENRALSVKSALVLSGVVNERFSIRGYGKTRPVAPNTHDDGSDDPEGRQKNRRVEIVIDTCSK